MSPHPLGMEKTWENPTLHHVWKPEELEERLNSQPRHSPEFISEKVLRFTIRGLYKGFNFISGYNGADPDPDAVAFRLLLLESVAGVPPFVAASHRHFRSLRAMERDNGWIHTLLEEAENERMHLLTFMKVFTPSFFTRSLVFGGQFVFGACFITLYVTSPRLAHRFVGYFEETAVFTYSQVIEHMEAEGSKLNEAWMPLPAPEIAKVYWRLPEDASLLDTIKQIAVDESMHRDVNHTFAGLAQDDPNPHVTDHLEDAAAYKPFESWKSFEGRVMDGKTLKDLGGLKSWEDR